MTSIGLAWTQARATRRTGPRRTPVLLQLVAWAGRTLPTWKRARSAAMQTGAFAAADFGLFHAGYTLAGWIGIGVSLLVLEFLGGQQR